MPYTRSGDDGFSATSNSPRLPKNSLIFELLGSLDHLNAHIGVARLHTADLVPWHQLLLQLQHDLFDLGAAINLDRAEFSCRLSLDHMEEAIDQLDAELPPLRQFILPGGHAAAAYFHLCRTQTRNTERLLSDWYTKEQPSLSAEVLRWMNRLSSLFFSLARYANQQAGLEDIKWSALT